MDHEIIECLETGNNSKVLEYLYKGIFPKIKSYVISNSGTEDDALDIFQDSVVILCKQINARKFNKQHEVAAFLFSVGRNLWINKAKRNKKITVFPENYEIDENENFSDLIITKEKRKILNEIIEKLGKKCFELLQYSIFHKAKPDEIIEKMGFSTVNAVKTQKYKCKKKLEQILEEKAVYKEVIE